MGDIVHTLPAVTALRQAMPDAMIGWIVEERWAELLCAISTPRRGPRSNQRPLVDHVHTVDTARWRQAPLSTQTWERIAATISELRANRYEAAIDFQGAIRSALVARWSAAPTSFGFVQPRENVASMFYTREIMPSGAHVVEQNYSLARAVVPELAPAPAVPFPVDPAAEREIGGWLDERGLRCFAVLNPGAGWGAKQWPAERYSTLAVQLAQRGIRSVVNGSAAEGPLMREVAEGSAGAAEPLPCSLSQLIVLLRRSALFVGGDTGPLHLAAALRTPAVAIFGPTDPARNGPYTSRAIVLRDSASQTSHKHIARSEPGLLNIGVEQVFAAACTMLASTEPMCGGAYR
jgi:heptosyltransferase-1